VGPVNVSGTNLTAKLLLATGRNHGGAIPIGTRCKIVGALFWALCIDHGRINVIELATFPFWSP
jgi:hypothetical protein